MIDWWPRGARRRPTARLGSRDRAMRIGRSRQPLGVLGAYVAVGAASTVVSIVVGRDPLSCDGWLGTRGVASVLLSLGLGVCLGAVMVGVTRTIARRAEWGRALHAALRPAVHGAGDGALFALAAASAACEELLFRGLLVPAVGIVGSSLVFGALHQIRGRGRWGWIALATLLGLSFAIIFAMTGSLIGPLVAHLAINHANLRFLRDNDPDPRPRPLGGLLNR